MENSTSTLASRKGDFSAFPATIYDPTSQSCAGTICSKQPFQGNQIPAQMISPVSESLQSYLPDPDNSGIQNNFLAGPPKILKNHSTTNKVDVNLSDIHTTGDNPAVLTTWARLAQEATARFA